MKLPDNEEENSSFSPSIILTIVLVLIFAVVLFSVVLISNTDFSEKQPKNSAVLKTKELEPKVITSDYPDTDELLKGSTLTPDDLDFWDKYPEESKEEETVEEKNEKTVKEKADPSTDGKHTLVENLDGTTEWVTISQYLPKNDYDYTKLVCQSNIMKYYVDGKLSSFVGVDISKYQDYIDFVKVKKAGVDYVIIKLGGRGYGSGQIIEDEYFTDNYKRATDAGLKVGVYFYSQAITEDEALEEANYCIEKLKDLNITYPVCFDMEYVKNDSCRIEKLTKTEKTTIANKFLTTIKDAGYKACIYGDKEWLIKEIDMSKLTAFDTWLSQSTDIPDYPYKFTMWQYSNQGTIDGIAGYVDLDISFIDYSEK